MRVASLAVALYDYLETAPTAYKFYKEHWEYRRFSISVILFAAIRLVSIAILTVSNVGHLTFVWASEGLYHFTSAGWVLLQQVYHRDMSPFLSAAPNIQSVAGHGVTRHPGTKLDREPRGNCRAFNEATHLGAWIFYAISMIYDVGITVLSIFYLLKYKLVMKNTMMAKVTKMMLYDGLGYLLVLTGVNILNLLLYKTSAEIQTAGSSLGYCVSWIMSQRLLIHLYDASRERNEGSYVEAVTLSQNVNTARDVSRVVRARFDRKGSVPFDPSRPAFEIEPSNPHHHNVVFPEDLGVQVLVVVSLLSFVAVVGLLSAIALSAWNTRHSTDRFLFVRTNAAAYFISLMVCWLIQCIGSIMNTHWLKDNAIFPGSFCVAQGLLKHVADIGVAVWTFAMAANTFYLLFLEMDTKRYIMWITLAVGWLFIAIIVGAGPAHAQATSKKSFYSVNGVWCWISPDHKIQMITMGYMIIFISASFSGILYLMTFFRLRGNLVRSGCRFKWRTVDDAADKYFANDRTKLVAKQVLLYPLAYAILVLPVAIVRIVAWSGHKVPFEVTIFSASVYLLSGFVNVILFTTTRRILPMSSLRIGSLYLVPSSRPSSDPGEDIEKGPTKMVTFAPNSRTRLSSPLSRKDSRRPPELVLTNVRDSFSSMYSAREGNYMGPPALSSHWSPDTPPLRKSHRVSVYLQSLATAAAKL
ncbi:hypothetical protein MD484_g4094, partial [Candolleomyces efflorescens]